MSEPDTPLVPGPLYGLRLWGVEGAPGHEWIGGYGDTPWCDGGEATRARCLAGGQHRAPQSGCTCGLYALHPGTLAARRLGPALRHPGRDTGVAGIVEAFGQVELHAEGFRAERARPYAFALAPNGSPDGEALVDSLARRYRARVIRVSSGGELVLFCRWNALGMSERTVDSLLSPAPWRPAGPWSVLDAIVELAGVSLLLAWVGVLTVEVLFS